jgi:hypothetical protein
MSALASSEARKHETVTRIRPESTMTPEKNRQTNAENQPQTRRKVRLPVPEEPAQPMIPAAPQGFAPTRATARDRLLRVAELVVGDWAPTLREAALRVVLFTLVLIAVGVAFGPSVALLGAVIGFLTFLVGRVSERG